MKEYQSPDNARSRRNKGFAETINRRIHAVKARSKDYGTDAYLITTDAWSALSSINAEESVALTRSTDEPL